jgi:hypothetical protein
MKDMKSRRERMAQFRAKRDWMDVVVLVTLWTAAFLFVLIVAHNVSRFL